MTKKVTSVAFTPSVLENIERVLDVYQLYPNKRSALIEYVMQEVTNTMLDTVVRQQGNRIIFDMNITLMFDEKEI